MTYDLQPNTSQKSFYGKARIEIMKDKTEILWSYETRVLLKTTTGEYIRLWDGWSATTGKHIKAYTGLNKREYFELKSQI